MKGMDYNRTKFLNHIAQSLGRDRKTIADVSTRTYGHQLRSHYLTSYDDNKHKLLNTFKSSLVDLGGQVVEIHSMEDLQNQLNKQIEVYKINQAVMWDDPRLHKVGIRKMLEKKNVSVVVWKGNNDKRQLTMQAEQSQIGITWADGALAETGTILLHNAGGKGRLVSLLPKIHLVLMEIEQLEKRWTDAMLLLHLLNKKSQLPSCINFISGPSSSADIQLEMVTGVHGPTEFVIMVLNCEKNKELRLP